MLGTVGVVFSEVILSLYPILIKIVPTNLDTQLLSRFGVFTLISLLFYEGPQIHILKTIIYGALTLFHVVASYVAFSSLSAGTAMSLFYTYPIMNVIAGILFLNESVPIISILFLAIGFIGTYLLSKEIPNEEVKGEKLMDIPVRYAIMAGLLAAFSETLMFLVVRETRSTNPINSMMALYPGALILYSVYLLFRNKLNTIDTSLSTTTKLTLFNCLIGFVGYAIRFYSINSVSTIVFSLLSFIGVISSYLFGKFFVNETPSINTLYSSLLIAFSAFGINYLQ